MSKKNKLILTKDFLEKEYLINQKNPSMIAKEVCVNETTVYNYLKVHNIKREDRTGQILPNTKFGQLTTISIIGKSKDGTLIWKCLCDCGNISNVRTSALKNGRVKSCGCIRRRTGNQNITWKGHEDITGSYWNIVKGNARTRGINLNITKEEVWNLYLNQNKKCYLSGLDISFKDKTASIDRIDSNLDYNINNIAICHKHINKIKFNLKLSEFIHYCNLIANYKPNILISITKNPIICKSFITNVYNGARNRNLSYEITVEDIKNIYLKQNGLCALSGIKLILPENNQQYVSKFHNASIDRIDSSYGYIKSNIQITCKLVNISKFDLDVEYYKRLCYLVSNFHQNMRVISEKTN